MNENNLKKAVAVCDSKVCSKCGEEKLLSEFYKRNNGLNRACKICIKERTNKYRIINIKEIKEKKKKYNLLHPEKNQQRCKKYMLLNVEKIKDDKKVYAQNNIEKIKSKGEKYYKENKETITEKKKKYNLKNKDKNKERYKNYRLNNKDKINNYFYNRKKTDPLFKMSCNLRNRTSRAFKFSFWKKNSSTIKLLGCDYKTAFEHLEKQFVDGMSWDNQGEWHIDHIIPLASANTEKEIETLCHYTNLQPLWAFDNMSKGAKIYAV